MQKLHHLQEERELLDDSSPILGNEIWNFQPNRPSSSDDSFESLKNVNHLQPQTDDPFNLFSPIDISINIQLPVSPSKPDSEPQKISPQLNAKIFQKTLIMKQNNNFPKLLMNRFFQFIEDRSDLTNKQRLQLLEVREQLKQGKFQKTNLGHFKKVFQKNFYHSENRRLLHQFLCGKEFVFETLLKSKAMKKQNKWRYLLGAKLAIIRSYSVDLAVRIQTNKEPSVKSD